MQAQTQILLGKVMIKDVNNCTSFLFLTQILVPVQIAAVTILTTVCGVDARQNNWL